ncbi:DUF2975 domain-containing protein [Neobacillus mesonae]|nr:DUF2975 domain-containing protein [Neobacillus mesonae]
MKLKKIFKWGSRICMILFYFVLLLGIFNIFDHMSYIWFPDSAFAQSFGGFTPIFSYADLYFNEEPALYSDTSFILLSLLSATTMTVVSLLSLWYMSKFLRNIYADSLFMNQNVTILYKLGIVIIVLGTVFTYTDGLLLSKTLDELIITNAQLVLTDYSYLDSILSGIFLIIIASALKIAVQAVEENKNTI